MIDCRQRSKVLAAFQVATMIEICGLAATGWFTAKAPVSWVGINREKKLHRPEACVHYEGRKSLAEWPRS